MQRNTLSVTRTALISHHSVSLPRLLQLSMFYPKWTYTTTTQCQHFRLGIEKNYWYVAEMKHPLLGENFW